MPAHELFTCDSDSDRELDDLRRLQKEQEERQAMSDALVRAMAAKAYSLESEDVQQAIRGALLLNGLCATSVDVRRLASRATQIVMALPSRHCLFTCLCVPGWELPDYAELPPLRVRRCCHQQQGG